MNRRLLFITVPLLLIGGVALSMGIGSMRAALRAMEVAVLPLANAATVEIREPGEVVLALRGRLGTRDFAAAEFTMRDAAGGPVDSSLILMRTATTSLSGETTLSVRRFQIRAAGRHELVVTGLDAATLSVGSRLVLTRPGGAAVALRVAWVVAAGVLLLAAIVFSALTIFLPRAPGGASRAPRHESTSTADVGRGTSASPTPAPTDVSSAARAAGTPGCRTHGDRGGA